ncbi:hypothetical protein [Candidatus Marithrix sp. Canyon 246]|uniref:hypothetical protein n=1 Tax=Candidatus Marithrix sp. Canyon 246 TaxID=1827136 RepID=UPI00403E1DB0
MVEKSSYPDATISTFSFIKFIKEYSKASYPLLPYILYFEKKKFERMVSEPLISKKNLKSVFCIEPNEIYLNDNANNVIIRLKNRVFDR